MKVASNPAAAIKRESERMSKLPEIAKPGTDADSEGGRRRLPPSLKASKDFMGHKTSQGDLLLSQNRSSNDYGGLREEKHRKSL